MITEPFRSGYITSSGGHVIGASELEQIRELRSALAGVGVTSLTIDKLLTVVRAMRSTPVVADEVDDDES